MSTPAGIANVQSGGMKITTVTAGMRFCASSAIGCGGTKNRMETNSDALPPGLIDKIRAALYAVMAGGYGEVRIVVTNHQVDLICTTKSVKVEAKNEG